MQQKARAVPATNCPSPVNERIPPQPLRPPLLIIRSSISRQSRTARGYALNHSRVCAPPTATDRTCSRLTCRLSFELTGLAEDFFLVDVLENKLLQVFGLGGEHNPIVLVFVRITEFFMTERIGLFFEG